MSDAMVGILFGFFGALWFGTAPIFVRLGLRYMRISTGTLVSMVGAFLVVGAIAVSLHYEEMLTLPLTIFGWFALLGLINYPLGWFLNFRAVQLAGVARITPVLATSPLWAMLFAVIFLDEVPGLLTFVGALSVVGGVAIIVGEGT